MLSFLFGDKVVKTTTTTEKTIQNSKKKYSEEDLKKAFFSGCQSERQIKPRIKCWEEYLEKIKKN